MRTLAISDIHGCYGEFNQLLRKIHFDPAEDTLVLLGDYVDRGANSREVVEKVKALKEDYGVITLRGNHDQMMYDVLIKDTEELNARWIRNGARQTIESYCGHDYFGEEMEKEKYIEAKKYIKSQYMHHLDFINSLDFYYESATHIFVHAGINPLYEDWRKQPHDDFIWIRDPFYSNPTGLDKKVVFGHTPVIYLHESEHIWFSPAGDKIGIDGGCVFGKQLNCLEISEDDEYTMHFIRKGETSLFDAV
ncbi:metallophosphoesterase family protein [Paenibacillus dokdonensis]|uniref:Metallophosphoesterase family protein n=1 Tax=Paenibacillus dokdonensis TaxID=2567944 RepID=A0ABU6GVZ5_9BACL|nr:metallophosphoesterase family protein [Paenibacillus dokdonensis]